jgi:hypothetical protein
MEVGGIYGGRWHLWREQRRTGNWIVECGEQTDSFENRSVFYRMGQDARVRGGQGVGTFS